MMANLSAGTCYLIITIISKSQNFDFCIIKFFLLQALENNLYRAPIYEHAMPTTDFVIIKTNNR